MEPDVQKRRNTERILLEVAKQNFIKIISCFKELKNVTSVRDFARGKRELDYSYESVGQRVKPDCFKEEPLKRPESELFSRATTPRYGADDPLKEYQREEERLRNIQSPFVDELRIANRKQQFRQESRSTMQTPINLNRITNLGFYFKNQKKKKFYFRFK